MAKALWTKVHSASFLWLYAIPAGEGQRDKGFWTVVFQAGFSCGKDPKSRFQLFSFPP